MNSESEWKRITSEEKSDDLKPARSIIVPGRRRMLAIVPDIHVPYHSEELVGNAIEVCKDASEIVFLGDLLDAYSLSSFDRNPARKATFKDEREIGREVLTKFREANRSAPMDFILGNHEDRLRRYLWRRAPELADMPELTIRSQLQLDRLNIECHPTTGFRRYGRRFKHGEKVRPRAGQSANLEMDAHRCSGFTGHTHRMGDSELLDKEGVHTSWWECGHLCDTTQADYVESPNWNPGMVIAYLDEYGGLTDVQRIDM